MDDDTMLDCDDFEKTLKVCVVGNGNVGKTSLTTRYAKGRFTDNYKKTIGVDFMERVVNIDGEDIHLMIWDTAGQEEFDTLTSRYYRGAGAVVYVFSTVDRDSFDALPSWQDKVRNECGSICQVLVQNKIDLIDDAAMSKAEVEDMKEKMRVKLYRASVQENKNVEEVFEYLCRRYLKKKTVDDDIAAVADINTLASGHDERTRSKSKKKNREKKDASSENVRYDEEEVPTTRRTKSKADYNSQPFDDIGTIKPDQSEPQAPEDIDLQEDQTYEPQDPPPATMAAPPQSAIEPSKRRTNGKKKKALYEAVGVMERYTYNVVTGEKLSYMHISDDVDSYAVKKKLQDDERMASEARLMAWEDYYAEQRDKKEKEATRRSRQRLQSQIDHLSKIQVTTHNFELWNTGLDLKYYEYVEYMLQNPLLKNDLLSNVSYGLTPLARACTIKDYRLVQVLLENGADPTAKNAGNPYAYMQSLIQAAVEDAIVFNLLVKYIPSSALAEELCALDSAGLNLLHLAAQGGFIQVLRRLLAMELTLPLVNAKVASSLKTVLHFAVLGGHVDCVELLLKHMATSLIPALTADGYNALHLALQPDSSHFHIDQLVECFITADCNVSLFEAPDSNGCTPLHLAVAQNLERISLRLIQHGKTPLNVCTKNGISALHLAVTVMNPTIVRALAQHNAMVDIMDDNGQTPLHTAALTNNSECIKLLLDVGADAGCQNKEGHTPLHYLASYCTEVSTFNLIIGKDVDINCKSGKGNLPLHFAAMKGNEVAAHVLVQHGADVSILNEDKRSVVFLARQWGHFDLEEYFKQLLKDPEEVVVSAASEGTSENLPLPNRTTHILGSSSRENSRKKKHNSIALPSLRPNTGVPAIANKFDGSTFVSETYSSQDAMCIPWSSQTPSQQICMTPYVKRQLYSRVRAPNQPHELTTEMELLLQYNKPPKPQLEHPETKNMVRRCKSGVKIPWHATMPLSADTLERRLKPSTKYQINSAFCMKSMPEIRAEYQFTEPLLWKQSIGKKRSLHDKFQSECIKR